MGLSLAVVSDIEEANCLLLKPQSVSNANVSVFIARTDFIIFDGGTKQCTMIFYTASVRTRP